MAGMHFALEFFCKVESLFSCFSGHVNIFRCAFLIGGVVPFAQDMVDDLREQARDQLEYHIFQFYAGCFF